MVQQLSTETSEQIIYPDSDGQPMADNTKQFRWIVTVKENLENLFATESNVFVAGDLLWYPVQETTKLAKHLMLWLLLADQKVIAVPISSGKKTTFPPGSV